MVARRRSGAVPAPGVHPSSAAAAHAETNSLEIENYRSICGPIEIRFPENQPLVLIGENNAGKSNIVRALDLVLGAMWQGNHDSEDHEFYGRSRGNPINIRARFDAAAKLGGCYQTVEWSHDAGAGVTECRAHPSIRGYSSGDYMKNDVKDECVCVVIEADRNLRYHLSYTSKYTFLSKLMHRFHKSLLADPATKRELESLFSEVKDRFSKAVQ